MVKSCTLIRENKPTYTKAVLYIPGGAGWAKQRDTKKEKIRKNVARFNLKPAPKKKTSEFFWVGLPFIHKKNHPNHSTHPLHPNPIHQAHTSAMRGTFCRAWTLRTLQPWPWRCWIVGPARWIGGLVPVGTGWMGVPFSDTFPTPRFCVFPKSGVGKWVFFGELDFFWGGIELVVKKKTGTLN